LFVYYFNSVILKQKIKVITLAIILIVLFKMLVPKISKLHKDLMVESIPQALAPCPHLSDSYLFLFHSFIFQFWVFLMRVLLYFILITYSIFQIWWPGTPGKIQECSLNKAGNPEEQEHLLLVGLALFTPMPAQLGPSLGP